jgi:AAA family ATP:ADP antiporter
MSERAAPSDVDVREPERTGLERTLSVFTEVKGGEGVTALLLTVNIFLLLTAYYVIKPVREALILSMKSGAEYKSYMSGAIAVALLGVVPLYARFARTLPRNRLVVGVTLFFVSHLVLFRILSAIPAVEPWLGLLFFLWVGIFNMMVVAQFWAFANDLYTEEQGKRLFALIGIGASTGAAAGSAVAKLLIEPLGVYQMMLVAGAILCLCAFLTQVAHVRETGGAGRRDPLSTTAAETPAAKKDDAPPKKEAPKAEGAYAMVFRYRYLTAMAAYSLLFSLINTNGEFILSSVVSDAAKEMLARGELTDATRKNWIGAWYGDFFLYVNVAGVILQSFVVSRVVKLGGLGTALFVFPLLALLDATVIALMPVIAVARWGKIAENASDYSFNNTVRNMLWLPTTRMMKYVAKQAVDTFFVRMGDVGSTLMVFVFAAQLGLGVRVFAVGNLVLCAALVGVCLLILREEKNIKAMRARGELPDDPAPAKG